MQQTVGFIGCGNMGSAIIHGLSKVKDFKVAGYDHNADKLEKLHTECGLIICQNEKDLVMQSDIIILAVKPHVVQDVVHEISSFLNSKKILCSIAAGISMETIKQASSFVCPVAIIMPNTPAMVGEACTALCFDDILLTEKQKEIIQKIFNTVGTTVILPETSFPEFSTLIGSGPAFVFYMLEAMMEGAIRLGFRYNDAKKLIDQLFVGSAKLAQENVDIDYARLRLNVCSPKGTTIVGMNSLDKNAVRGAIIEAIIATYERNLELIKKNN